jgi:hypothetical protein
MLHNEVLVHAHKSYSILHHEGVLLGSSYNDENSLTLLGSQERSPRNIVQRG